MNAIATTNAAQVKAAAEDRKAAVAALDMLGAFIGPKVYDRAKESLHLRAAMWIGEGAVSLADIKAACRQIASPEVSARIEWDNELLAEFSRRVLTARNQRIDSERRRAEEEERERWAAEAADPAGRARVVELLEQIGTAVYEANGGRRYTPKPRPQNVE